MLNDLGIRKKTIRSCLSRNGGKLFYEVQLPEYKFNAAEDGVRNSALDGTATKDEYVPRLIVRNSYDKSSSFSIIYGGFRYICRNGVMVGERIHEIRLLHRGEEIDFSELREPFIENIVATIDGLKTTYKTLNQEDGHRYFEMLILEEAIAMKYRRMMIDQMTSFEQVHYDKDEEGRLQPVGSRQRKEFTAYLLWSILTGIATHYVKSAQARFRMQQLVCQRFTE
jgi:hypothetical protein